ncbi:MAG: hypothetical protein WDZ31_09280 [Phycisphaeraceae bacterium]
METLHEMLRQRPFQPFRIVLTSGDKYDVHHPDLVVVMLSQVFVAEPRSDRFHFLRLNQIAALESLREAA